MDEPFTTSYITPASRELIGSFVRLMDPKLTVEIGTQQGSSATLIGCNMGKESSLYTFDLFQDQYANPPYAATHADMSAAITNMNNANLSCEWRLFVGDHTLALDIIKASGLTIDLLHIDICNHYDNVRPVLSALLPYVAKAVILEGGVLNQWQQKHNYKPWHFILEEEWFASYWRSLIIPLSNNHNAVTLCMKK